MHRAHNAQHEQTLQLLNLIKKKKPLRRQQNRKVQKQLGEIPLTKHSRQSCSANRAGGQQGDSRSGTGTADQGTTGVALALLTLRGAQGEPWGHPQGRWPWPGWCCCLSSLSCSLAARPGWVSVSPTRAAGKGTPGTGDSSEVTASVHRAAAKLLSPILQFFFPEVEQFFSPSAPFSLQ